MPSMMPTTAPTPGAPRASARGPGRSGWTAAALAVLVLLLSGCEVLLEQGTAVEADGSGTLALTAAMDDEMRELLELEAGGVDVTRPFSDPAGAASPFGSLDVDIARDIDGVVSVDVEPYRRGSFQGETLRVTFDDLDGLRRIGDALVRPDPATGPPPFDRFEVVRDGDRFAFAAESTPPGVGASADVGAFAATRVCRRTRVRRCTRSGVNPHANRCDARSDGPRRPDRSPPRTPRHDG